MQLPHAMTATHHYSPTPQLAHIATLTHCNSHKLKFLYTAAVTHRNSQTPQFPLTATLPTLTLPYRNAHTSEPPQTAITVHYNCHAQ